jgi:hypothetical protein
MAFWELQIFFQPDIEAPKTCLVGLEADEEKRHGHKTCCERNDEQRVPHCRVISEARAANSEDEDAHWFATLSYPQRSQSNESSAFRSYTRAPQFR